MNFSKEEIFKTKRRISTYSMLVNGFLATIKLIGGIIARSSVLIADAIHSFSDLAALLFQTVKANHFLTVYTK